MSTTDTAPAPDTAMVGSWHLPLTVLVMGMFMSVLDTSIVNVVVPTIERTFGATTDQVAWIVTAYGVSLAVVIPLSAWLADRFGARRVYVWALVAFGVASALCGIAWNLNSLILFRVLQAIPGGLLPPLSLTILYRIVPPAEIGRAMGAYGLGVVVAPAMGPALGGYLVEYLDWRLIFFINVPIGLIAAIATVRLLPAFPPEGRPKFDILGFTTSASGLAALLLALSEGSSWGWSSFSVVSMLCFAAVMLALFVIVELEVEKPLLDVRVFRYWHCATSLVLVSVLSIGLFTVLFYMPVFLQNVQGLGAFDAGLILLPQALGMVLAMPLSARLYDLIGPRWPTVAGLSMAAYGSFLLHNLQVDTPHHTVALLLTFRTIGVGLAFLPALTTALASVPPQMVSFASAFNNVIQQSSAALGLAVMGVVLTSATSQISADRAALMMPGTPVPDFGAGPSGDLLGFYAMYAFTSTTAFVDALNNVMVILGILTLCGILLALWLPTGPPQTDDDRPVMMH